MSEPRFDLPLSGAYYQIEGPGGAILTSRSLWDEQLPPGKSGHRGVLMADLPGPRGQHLRMAERDIVPLGSPGLVHVLVAEADDEIVAEVAQTRQLLGLGFVLLGAGVVAAVVLQAAIGLRGLRRLRGAVAELRASGAFGAQLDVPFEVRPLVQEITALVRQNRDTVERARHHVGNLAHALRTRLSIMRNALDSGDIDLIGQELAGADRLVHHHLARARAASLAGTAANDVPVMSVANDLCRALGILFAARHLLIEASGDADLQVRCDRDDLAEMLGNLLENACKWSRSRVRVTVRQTGDQVVATVSDDGPGLPAARLHEVQSRGVRLDENVPGSGLGLAIATDLATLYGGKLSLVSPGPDGGLAASLALPYARRNVAHMNRPVPAV